LLFYVGGTILVPKWSVVVKVFLDYMQFSVQGNDDVMTSSIGSQTMMLMTMTSIMSHL